MKQLQSSHSRDGKGLAEVNRRLNESTSKWFWENTEHKYTMKSLQMKLKQLQSVVDYIVNGYAEKY